MKTRLALYETREDCCLPVGVISNSSISEYTLESLRQSGRVLIARPVEASYASQIREWVMSQPLSKDVSSVESLVA